MSNGIIENINTVLDRTFDERPPERLNEAERMKRYLAHPYVLEAVVFHKDEKQPPIIGRCPWPAPIEGVRARAREMLALGKDISCVVIRDTRSWKVLEIEKR